VYIICARKRFPVGYYDEEFTVYEAVPTPQTPGYFV
jgi:hypothetical protein